MKIIFYLFLLFSTFSLAENNVTIEKFMVYKTIDSHLNLNEIKTKLSEFEPLTVQRKLNEKNTTYWILIQLNKNMQSGTYIVGYRGYHFDISSLNSKNVYHFMADRERYYQFNYEKGKDSLLYYFKVKKDKLDFSLNSVTQFYKSGRSVPRISSYLLICGLIIGLIFMVMVYNLSIYFYTKELSFLFYSLMEMFMIPILLYHTDVIPWDAFNYSILSLFTLLFTILFARSFLETKKYLPNLDKVLLI